METITPIIYSFLTVFSIGLLVVSFISYRRFKNPKLPFISVVLLIFSLKGILLTINLFYEIISLNILYPFFGLFDLVIVLLLFFAMLKR